MKIRSINRMISIIQLLQAKIGFVERDVVYFEGGLGAQIISYMEFKQKELEIIRSGNLNKRLQCDISYFSKYSPGPTDSGLIVRKWKLDRYGITLKSLQPYQVSRIRKLMKSRRRHPLRLANIDNNDWQIRREITKNSFEIPNKDLLKTVNFFGSLENSYACVHIRRGDFSAMKALTVDDGEIFNVLKRSESFLPSNVFIISDSNLASDFKLSIQQILQNFSIHFIEGEDMDEGLIHDFMRESDVLICGNSMYSFSAGLLANSKTLVLAPLIFFFGDEKIPNSGRIYSLPFTSAGDYFILR